MESHEHQGLLDTGLPFQGLVFWRKPSHCRRVNLSPVRREKPHSNLNRKVPYKDFLTVTGDWVVKGNERAKLCISSRFRASAIPRAEVGPPGESLPGLPRPDPDLDGEHTSRAPDWQGSHCGAPWKSALRCPGKPLTEGVLRFKQLPLGALSSHRVLKIIFTLSSKTLLNEISIFPPVSKCGAVKTMVPVCRSARVGWLMLRHQRFTHHCFCAVSVSGNTMKKNKNS